MSDLKILKEKHLAEFEKRTTQEMIDAPTYLHWTDEQLGGITRALANDLVDTYGDVALQVGACVYLILDGFAGQVESASFKTPDGKTVTIKVS